MKRNFFVCALLGALTCACLCGCGTKDRIRRNVSLDGSCYVMPFRHPEPPRRKHLPPPPAEWIRRSRAPRDCPRDCPEEKQTEPGSERAKESEPAN